MRARYSHEFRLSLVKEVAKSKPAYAELIVLLKSKGVPRSTFQSWWKKFLETGDVAEKPRGRPPAGFREIVREEVKKGLEDYFDGSDPPKKKRVG